MNATAFSVSDWMAASPSLAEPMRVAILYDQWPSLAKAENAVASLAKAAGSKSRIQHTSWTFNMLTRLDVRHASAAIATETDILMVAAAASVPLPLHVKTWLSECLRDNAKGKPLVVGLYDPCHGLSHLELPFSADLLCTAGHWDLCLLFNSEFDSQYEWSRWAHLSHCQRPRDSRFNSETLQHVHNIGRWGINE